ncbi:hypothetical protein ABT364_07025 [Massilia sp. SR12]
MSQQINLFNPIFLKQRKIFTAAHMVQTLGAVLAGALLIVAFGAMKTQQLGTHAAAGKVALERREARLAEISVKFPPRQKSKALEDELGRKRSELNALRDVQGVLERGDLGNTAGYSEYLRAFARRDVHGVWLTGLTIVGAGRDIALEGRALQPEQVPSYINGLTREAVLQGKTFASLEIGRPATAPVGTAGAQGIPTAMKEAPVAPYIEFRLMSQPAGERE